MKYKFYLFYAMPANWDVVATVDYFIEVAIGGVVAAKGLEDQLIIWFEREADDLPSAVIVARKDVARVLPYARFDFAADKYQF